MIGSPAGETAAVSCLGQFDRTGELCVNQGQPEGCRLGESIMTSAQICITAVIILYLCFVIFTGVMIGRRSKKNSEGFYLGGRGMGPLVTAMSAEASDMSSWLLMEIGRASCRERV